MGRMRRTPTARTLVGSLEYEVLELLWARFPMSVGDVLDGVNRVRATGDQLAYTTIMTVLSRLHEKGILDRERQGRGYQYRPRYTEDELVRQFSRVEVQRLVDRFGPVALAQFVSVLEGVDPDRLAQLLELAEEDDDG